jgi:hypothetical protein
VNRKARRVVVRKDAPGHLVAGGFEAQLFRLCDGATFHGWVVFPIGRQQEANDRYMTEREAREALIDLIETAEVQS